MPQPIDIDYARAESADVVRKKFRRRVVMFVVVTVVVMVIGCGWMSTMHKWFQIIDSNSLAVASYEGEIRMNGPSRALTAPTMGGTGIMPHYFRYSNRALGFEFRIYRKPGLPKWDVFIRYRTLFLLATIPWIITLIRLIRSWKWKRGLESNGTAHGTEPRTK